MNKKILMVMAIATGLLSGSTVMADITSYKGSVGAVAEATTIPVVRFLAVTYDHKIYVADHKDHLLETLSSMGATDIKLGEELGGDKAKQYLAALRTEVGSSSAGFMGTTALAAVPSGDEFELMRPVAALTDYVELTAIKIKPSQVSQFRQSITQGLGLPSPVKLEIENQGDLEHMDRPTW